MIVYAVTAWQVRGPGILACLRCVAFQTWWIIPYTRLWPVEVLDASGAKPCLRLMTANVLTPNRAAPRFVRLMREHNPDILTTLESNAWWQQSVNKWLGAGAGLLLLAVLVYPSTPQGPAQVDKTLAERFLQGDTWIYWPNWWPGRQTLPFSGGG